MAPQSRVGGTFELSTSCAGQTKRQGSRGPGDSPQGESPRISPPIPPDLHYSTNVKYVQYGKMGANVTFKNRG